MAIDPKQDAALALHRFGFGPRVGSIAAIAADPRGALIAELDRPGAAIITNPDLLSSGDAARAMFDFRQERRAVRLADRAAREQERQTPNAARAPAEESAKAPTAPADGMSAGAASDAAMAPMSAPSNQSASQPPRNPAPGVPQQLYLAEARARVEAALGGGIGFVERLVWFWSNHFCVS